jgi:hypothetical protein
MQVGVEGRLGQSFFLRSGYQLAFLDSETGGLTGLSCGLGVKLGSLVLDYAYLPYGRIGNSHRLSLSFQFDDGSADPPVVKVPQAAPAQAQVPKPAPRPATQGNGGASSPAPSPPRPALSSSGSPSSVDMVFDVAPTQEEQLLQATKDRPQDAAAWKALGRYYYGKKDKPRMLEAFRMAVELDPDDKALKDWFGKVSR